MPAGSHTVFAAVFSILLTASIAFAQSASEWQIEGDTQYAHGEFEQSAASYQHAIEAGAEGATIYYNAACSAALAGQVDVSCDHLERAIAKGWRDVNHLRTDRDLQSLRDEMRWSEIVAACEEAEADYAASMAAPELRAELLEMKRIDQAARRGEEIPELEDISIGDVDARNLARMREIVEDHGWPVISLVGDDGASAAWILVQHADTDPAFQRDCLELMRAAPEGDVSAVDVAYLIDRVRVNEGNEQVFGTQFHQVEGESVPRPIEDEAGVEARRAAAGMMSMKDYTKLMTGR